MSDKVYAVVCVDKMRDLLDGKSGARDEDAILGPFESRALAELRVEQIKAFGMCHSEHRVLEVSGA